MPYCGSSTRHTLILEILENYVFITLSDVRQCDRKGNLVVVLSTGTVCVEKPIGSVQLSCSVLSYSL